VGKTFGRHRSSMPGRGIPSSGQQPEDKMDALLISFGIIFVAELGDKSQLMALAFASRYRALPILVGITAATAVVHLFSVLLGAVVGVALPTKTISIVAGLAFFAFAAWTLRGDSLAEDEAAKANRSTKSAILAVAVAFFLAELGDKTMLATVALATKQGLFATWLGSTLGMVAADGLAIVVGQQLGARLPERAVKIGAAVCFTIFGIVLILEGLR
jgi:putative Ca2+/H+ antiporter (TMEM165/GDT1 family)